jgi:hypothetical protein
VSGGPGLADFDAEGLKKVYEAADKKCYIRLTSTMNAD